MKQRLLSLVLLVAMVISLLPSLAIESKAAPSATAAEVTALFNARSKGKHPRILADSEDFARIRRQIRTDPYMAILYERIYDYSLTQLTTAVSKYEIPDGVRLLGVSRTASQRIVWLGLTYQISGERRFADRAIAEMMAVSKFSDWHPAHYLDVAQMAYGVGLGYDWLYYEMTSSQRSTVRSALYNYAVNSTPGWSYKATTSNWNPWCHGGVAIAAAAIFEDYSSACASYLAGSVTDIQKALKVMAPLGAYPEGPGYFTVASLFTALFCDTLQTVLGTDFGVSDIEGVKESGNYLLAMNGNVSTFNFGDGSANLQDTAALHWFADHFHMPQLSIYQRKMQTTATQAEEPLSLLWYNPEVVEGVSEEDKQLDYLLYSNVNESIASFRSAPGDARQIYAGIKAGYNSTSHSDMDIGTFVMEAMGIRFFEEMGSDSYNLPGYGSNVNGVYTEDGKRWTYYRKRAEGQNTLVLNPGTKGGQDSTAKAQITAYNSSPDGGYAMVDMLDAYDSYKATSATRGLLLFDNRSRVLLRDEIKCSASSTLYWFAHTRSAITLSADKKTATLTNSGKTLLAQIVSPSNATFSVMDAQPLSTSPNPSGQNSRSGWRKLSICLKGITSANISVVFTPILEESDKNKPLPTSLTLSNMASQLNPYTSGTTLEPNPEGIYEIYSADQLHLLSKEVAAGNTFSGKTIRLMTDIDLKGQTFTPIGGNGTSNSFKGTFDGNYHVVKNLCIFLKSVSAVGFFGRVDYATIKNFGIESGIVFAGEKSGALVGIFNHSTMTGCFNRAPVISTGGHVGGLIGQLGGKSTIDSCYNHAKIQSYGNIVGGLIGYLSSKTNLTLTNSYHVGALGASSGTTGMVAYYNTGNSSMYPEKVTIQNCLSTTAIKHSSVANLSSVESLSGNATVSEARLVGSAVTLGSAFIADCKWQNDGFPVFTWQNDVTLPQDLHIRTAPELRLLSHTVNSGADSFAGKTVYLAEDIDLDSREWVPIGGNQIENVAGNRFKGTFDGQGYAVRNLKVSANNCFAGFFGVFYGGTLKNFGIQSGSVQGNIKVGGLVGWLTGNVSNCYNRATVTASNYVGGIAGMASMSHIENTFNNANVTGNDMSGGIVGYYSSGASGSTITNCYHNGTVTGSNAGTCVGIINSASTGLVFKNSYAPKGYPFVITNTGRTLSGCSTLVADDLKAAAPKLGSAFTYDNVNHRNDGYPILNHSLYKGDTMEELPADENGIYHINSTTDLRRLSYMVNVLGNTLTGKTVVLEQDLDLENREWIPIGGNTPNDDISKPSFDGTFLGRGHRIYNLSISSGNLYTGLFGLLRNGSISDLGIESGTVMGKEKVAGLAGCIRGSALRNCYNKATVCGSSITGGIFGMCGGVNTVENCYNTGFVQAPITVAGIGGYAASDASNTRILNCYNLGKGSAGILGTVNSGTTGVTVENCFTHNAVALVSTQNTGIIKDSSTKTAAEIRALAPTLGDAFAEDYQANNWAYPVLAWENGDAPSSLTEENGVYTIGSVEELRLLSYLVRKGNSFAGKEILLTTDLDLENKPWLPIGGADEVGNSFFGGIFRGQGHLIYHLKVANSEYECTGLFGKLSGGTVEDLGIESGIVIGKTKVAGLVGGLTNGSALRRCYNKAFVYAESISGGLVGIVGGENCVVENCYNRGEVYAKARSSNTGGLVGYYASSAVNCSLTNSYGVGNYHALVGSFNSSATGNTVDNCYTCDTVLPIRTPSSTFVTGTAQLSSDTLKNYAPILGPAFADDTEDRNSGYPVLLWENAPEIREPIQDDSIKIGHTLNLASDISVNFAVAKSLLEGFDMSTVYLECSVDIYENNTKTGTDTVKLLPVEQEYFYYFTLEGITAVQMNDTITTVLYGTRDGKSYCSPTDIYSIATYAYSQLNKDGTGANLKTLCADLLRYGSAAQSFKGYRTDAPVDSAMTETHRAYLSNLDAVAFGNTNRVLDDLSDPVITWVGKALDLNSKVSLKFILNASTYTGDPSELRLKVSYTDYAGRAQLLYMEGAEAYASAGCYAFTFDGFLVAELRSVVSVQVCCGTTPLSCTLEYSADTYGNNKTGTLLTLCKALFAYSDSAKIYFVN